MLKLKNKLRDWISESLESFVGSVNVQANVTDVTKDDNKITKVFI